jgi:hypothetical protein
MDRRAWCESSLTGGCSGLPDRPWRRVSTLGIAGGRLFTLDPDNEPLWVRLYVYRMEEVWAAILVADDALPPVSGDLKGLAFFGANPEEADRQATAYLGVSEPVN